MNLLSKIPKPVTRFAGKIFMKLKNVSPELCIIGGIVCGAGAIVTVGVQTYKHYEELELDAGEIRAWTKDFVPVDDMKKMSLRERRKIVVHPETGEHLYPKKNDLKKLTDEQKKALWDARFNLGKDILRIYWLPIGLEAASICLTWGGRTQLRSRLTEMTAMYTLAVSKYKDLYEQIRKKYGDDVAQELAYGVRETVFYEDGETGNVGTATWCDKEGMSSPYAQMFDAGEFDPETGEWPWKNPMYSDIKVNNYLTVKRAQDEAYRQIIKNGWCIWGQIKQEYLGLKPAPGDFRVGWWYKEGQDNHVDFRVFDDRWQLPYNRGFADVNDPQKTCIIDPNMDGCIDFVFDNIEKYDFRCGKRKQKVKRVPNDREMFGEEFARKLH